MGLLYEVNSPGCVGLSEFTYHPLARIDGYSVLDESTVQFSILFTLVYQENLTHYRILLEECLFVSIGIDL